MEEAKRISEQAEATRLRGDFWLTIVDESEPNSKDRNKKTKLSTVIKLIEDGYMAPENTAWLSQPVLIQEGTEIRVSNQAVANWSGVIVSYPEDALIANVTLPAEGLKRIDTIVADHEGNYYLILGDVSVNPIQKSVPADMLLVGYAHWGNSGAEAATGKLALLTDQDLFSLPYGERVYMAYYLDTTGKNFPEGIASFNGIIRSTKKEGLNGFLELINTSGEIWYNGYYWSASGPVWSEWKQGGGGSGKFKEDIPLVLASGKSLGRYTGTGTIPAAGKTVEEVIRDIAFEFIMPTLTMNLSQTIFEVGSTGSTNISGAITPNSETNITNKQLLRRPASGGEWAAAGSLTNGLSYAFNGVQATESTVFRFEFLGATSGVVGQERTFVMDLYHWYGPAAAQPTAATTRNLAGKIYRTQGNTFTLNTGSAERRFYIILAPGESLVSVVDQDASNAVVTSFYNLVNSNFSVNDASGTPVAGYKLYEMVASVPYSSNHRHNVTIG